MKTKNYIAIAAISILATVLAAFIPITSQYRKQVRQQEKERERIEKVLSDSIVDLKKRLVEYGAAIESLEQMKEEQDKEYSERIETLQRRLEREKNRIAVMTLDQSTERLRDDFKRDSLDVSRYPKKMKIDDQLIVAIDSIQTKATITTNELSRAREEQLNVAASQLSYLAEVNDRQVTLNRGLYSDLSKAKTDIENRKRLEKNLYENVDALKGQVTDQKKRKIKNTAIGTVLGFVGGIVTILLLN